VVDSWRFPNGFVDDALYYAEGQARHDAVLAAGDADEAQEIAGLYNLAYQQELSGFTLAGFAAAYDEANRINQSGAYLLIEIDGVLRQRCNSNGKSIHPEKQGIVNFWRWFGNSKAVDQFGRPQVVYHGTKADFGAFSNWPIFTTPDPVVASAYAAGTYSEDPDSAANVIPVYLSTGNLKTYTEAELIAEIGGTSKGHIEWANFDGLADSLMREGYDGLHIIGAMDYSGGGQEDTRYHRYDQFVAFYQTQFKSAIGNSGRFDPDCLSLCDTTRLAPKSSMSM
jgi:hypothetical protein